MKITRVRVTLPTKKDANYKAFASITLAGGIVIDSIRIVEREDGGLFIRMPANRGKDEKFHDNCHPVTSECRAAITDVVLARYKEVVEDNSLSNIPKDTGVANDTLNITEVRFNPINADNENFKGFATVTLDNEFALKSIRLVEREDGSGFFLAYPGYMKGRKEDGNQERVEYYHPITAAASEALKNAVIAQYKLVEAAKA